MNCAQVFGGAFNTAKGHHAQQLRCDRPMSCIASSDVTTKPITCIVINWITAM